ncbi:MAG: phage tail tape measure protein, partial [Proteobacteria bacterium]|nr:phage tail tape measure protein [Pseudomonadota bacterium]
MSTSQSLRLQVILGAVDQLTRPLQGMMQGSHKLSGAVKEARDRLRDLEAQQRRIGNYQGATQALTDNARALDTARDKLRALRDQIIATERPHKALTDEYKAARREVRQLERDNTRLARSQSDARTQIERSGIPVSQLASRQRELAAQIDRANGQLNEHGRRLAAVRERQREWNRAMEARNQLLNAGAGLLATGTAMGLPVVGMVKDFATFEDAMLGVAKQVEGARDANGQLTRTYYDMADAIRTLSTDARIGQSAVQIAALVEAGARMGIQGKDNLLEYARTAGMAATAFSAAADQIGEDIAKVANLYKIPIANIGELGDTINWLDDNAQSKGGDIINVLTRIAGISQTVRMSFRDAAALGSTMLSLGASAEVAATGANAVIRELAIAANQPARFQDALKSLGLAPDAVQAGMLKDSTGTILRVLEAIKALPAENQLATTVGLFGKEYGDDVAKLAENMDEYRRQLALANSEQAKGSMAREADARAMALSARWQVAMNGLFNASSRAGETLKGTLVGILEAVGRAVSAIDGWMQRNPGFTSALMHVAAAVAAIVTGLGALALGVAAVIGPIAVLKFGLGFIAPLLAGISAPALAVVGVVGAVGLAAWALYENWDKVKAKFVGLWEGIKAIFQGGVDWVLKKIESLRNAVSLNFNATVGTPAAAAPLRTAAASGGNVTS